ncbi:MAG: hypothetical protein KI786_00645 [Mameliella sp.]|nr:hypothetical protein [Phaeodactylibacter sp.]
MSGSGAAQGGGSNEAIAKSIKMDAFRRIEPGSGSYGHLRIVANTGYVRISKGEKQTETRKRKNKDGKETSTTYHWYNFPVQINANFKVLDPENNVLASETSQVNTKHKSTEYVSHATAYKNYAASYNAAKKNAASKCVSALRERISSTLINKFDFKKRKIYNKLYIIKKHDLENGFQDAFDQTKAFFGNEENLCKTSEEVLAALNEPISFWEKHADTPTDDKKSARIHKAANYNLALVYIHTDQYEKAKKHAENILAVQKKYLKAQRIVTGCGIMQEKLEAQGLASRRFCRDVSNAPGPAKVAAFKEEQEELESSANADEGTISIGGDTISGSFILAEGADQLLFGPKGNITFKAQKGNEFVEYELSADSISSFSFSGRTFVKRKYTPRAKGKEESMTCILEEVYASDKITLYEYFPVAASLADATSEYALEKTGDAEPTSLSGTSFLLWKKGIAKYFEDCADLNAMCLEGGIQQDKESLIKAARIYSELCE